MLCLEAHVNRYLEYGHTKGDHVLQDISKVLYSKIRSSDIACRYGGDEFVLTMAECTRAGAEKRMSAIRSIIAQIAFAYEERYLEHVTMTYGVSTLPDDASSAADLLSAADRAFYLQK